MAAGRHIHRQSRIVWFTGPDNFTVRPIPHRARPPALRVALRRAAPTASLASYMPKAWAALQNRAGPRCLGKGLRQCQLRTLHKRQSKETQSKARLNVNRSKTGPNVLDMYTVKGHCYIRFWLLVLLSTPLHGRQQAALVWLIAIIPPCRGLVLHLMRLRQIDVCVRKQDE